MDRQSDRKETDQKKKKSWIRWPKTHQVKLLVFCCLLFSFTTRENAVVFIFSCCERI